MKLEPWFGAPSEASVSEKPNSGSIRGGVGSST